MTTWISREAGVTLAARPLSDHARHWHCTGIRPAGTLPQCSGTGSLRLRRPSERGCPQVA